MTTDLANAALDLLRESVRIAVLVGCVAFVWKRTRR